MQEFARDLLGCEAAGIPIAPKTHAWIVQQCAAQSLHRPVAGLLPRDPAPPFPPPPHHFANMQAWLQTFVGTIERKAPWSDVEPHWRSFLEVWPYHGSTVGCSTTTGDFFQDATVRANENPLTL
ncbi:MAG: hypothetical protein V4850_21495 [Myxococcota bacterium]